MNKTLNRRARAIFGRRLIQLVILLCSAGCALRPGSVPGQHSGSSIPEIAHRPQHAGLRVSRSTISSSAASTKLAKVSAAAVLIREKAAPPAAVLEPTPAAVPCLSPDDLGEPMGLHRGDRFKRGEVVLTFDDGPYVKKTPKVLDLLAKHQFNATFFVLGRHITSRTYSLLQRMEAEGHLIGSHSYDHDMEMTKGWNNDKTINYIRGQHEIARVLIELALLARSPEHFDQLYTKAFQTAPGKRLRAKTLRGWQAVATRHQQILIEQGHPQGRYAVRYSRPPGGGPYLGRGKTGRARYDAALEKLGMLNVMWHRLSGDVHPTRAREYSFLLNKLSSGARSGGVLLIHDFIRSDVLAKGLAAMAADPQVSVLSIDKATTAKYGCAAADLEV